MKPLGPLLVAATLTLSVGAAQAHTCRWLDDHYVVSCDQEGCKPLFRAVQVPDYGRCIRVTRVGPFPRWAEEPILALVSDPTPPSTPVVISVEYVRFYSEVARGAADLEHGLASPAIVEHAEKPVVVRGWYENRSAAEAHWVRKRWIGDITAYIAAVFVLIGSTAWLMRSLWGAERRRQRRALRASLAFKACAMALQVGAFFLEPGLFWGLPPLIVLFAPAAVVFMLCDWAAFLALRSPEGARPG